MKLTEQQKFIMQDNDGNLIIVTEIDFDFNNLQNKIILMKGKLFNVDMDDEKFKEIAEVNIQTSFTIDMVYDQNEE